MPKKRGGDGWSFRPANEPLETRTVTSLPAAEQRCRVALEKRAKSKVVTIVQDLVLSAADLKALGKALKAACGTGGTVKDATVELQGDCRETVTRWLESNGWGMRG